VRKNLIHLAPNDSQFTGIASYSDNFDKALAKYSSEVFDLHRVDPDTFLKELNAYPPDFIILAEIGINEGRIFQSLRNQQRTRPDLIRIIVVHDPPRFVHSIFSFFDLLSITKAGRGVRRIFNYFYADLVERKFIQPKDIFVCLCQAGVKDLKIKLNCFGKENQVCYLPHLNYLDPIPQLKTKLIPTRKIGFFGFITPQKGIHILFEAAQKLLMKSGIDAIPAIEIHGKALGASNRSYMSGLQSRIVNAGLKDKFTLGGFISDDHIVDFMSQIDLLALPYVKETGLSASGPMQWARTCGVPVLAADTRSFRSLVNHGEDGLLIPVSDTTKWSEVLRRTAEGNLPLQKLRLGASKKQYEASWEQVVKQFVDLIALYRGKTMSARHQL
jgi:glycosyltransferase involved in cell wall biosynthesis